MNRRKGMQLNQLEQILKEVHLFDLQNKMEMAEQISRYVKMDIRINEITPSFLGISDRIYTQLTETLEFIKNVDFPQLAERQNRFPIDQNNFTYMDIRDLLIYHYIEKQEIPTKELLIVDLEHKAILCNDDTFNNCLKLRGFIWRQLPTSNKRILTEHPKRVAERHRYFKKLKQYRDDNRPMFYIEESSYANVKIRDTKHKKYKQPCFIAVFTENTLIKMYSYLYPRVAENNMYEWIKTVLIPLLSTNSVVVIDEELNDEVDNYQFPNALNSKAEIKEWLKSNDIPHEGTMCKAELMILVNKFTEERETMLENILKMHGHEVLRRPKDFPNLSVIESVKKYIPKKEKKKKKRESDDRNYKTAKLFDVLSGLTDEQWKQLFDHVKSEEKKILTDDLILDGVIDKLMYLISQGGFTECHHLDDFEQDLDFYVFEKKYVKTGGKMSFCTENK